LKELPVVVVPQSRYKVADAEETGLTFVENALLKARHAASETGRPAIADDSGIEVPALDGAPGIFSARFAGARSSDSANNEKLLEVMRDLEGTDRSANFRCVIVYLRRASDPAPIIAEGVWHGQILRAPRGSNGFGYDPLFFDPHEGATGAELDPARKNLISHRGKAARLLRQKLMAGEGWSESE